MCLHLQLGFRLLSHKCEHSCHAHAKRSVFTSCYCGDRSAQQQDESTINPPAPYATHASLSPQAALFLPYSPLPSADRALPALGSACPPLPPFTSPPTHPPGCRSPCLRGSSRPRSSCPCCCCSRGAPPLSVKVRGAAGVRPWDSCNSPPCPCCCSIQPAGKAASVQKGEMTEGFRV